MQKQLLALLFLSMISLAYAEDKGLDHKIRADAAMKKYFDCSIDYARKLATSNASATATEIASAAHSECEGSSLKYRSASYDYARSNTSELRAREFSESVTANLRSRGHGAVVNAVLKARSSTESQ